MEFKKRYVILPVNTEGKDINPSAYSYFLNFFNDLVNRGGEPYNSKLEPYRRMPLDSAERLAPPFYWVFNVKPSLAPYKVVWKRIAGAITWKAVSFACAAVEPMEGKPVVPDDSTILVVADSPEEAYYIAVFLNSTIARTIIASYT